MVCEAQAQTNGTFPKAYFLKVEATSPMLRCLYEELRYRAYLRYLTLMLAYSTRQVVS